MRTRIVVGVAVVCSAGALGAGALASGAGQPAPLAKQGAGNKALFGVLTGRNEVDDQGRRGAGDANGRGAFMAIADGNELCFGITVKNTDEPVAAHIHRGRGNQNGPVVVPLTQPSSGDPGASSGCVEVDAQLLQSILASPRRFYANVHTTAFGGGAVRGQLFRRPR